jgi:hypothetical protein
VETLLKGELSNRQRIEGTDIGPTAVGGILMQDDEHGGKRSLRFESRTQNSAERKCSRLKKELLGILHYLRSIRYNLYGRHSIPRIDPATVKGTLRDHKQIKATGSRWVAYEWQSDYELQHIPGVTTVRTG